MPWIMITACILSFMAGYLFHKEQTKEKLAFIQAEVLLLADLQKRRVAEYKSMIDNLKAQLEGNKCLN